MIPLPASIIFVLVFLAAFLIFTVVLNYTVPREFTRTRALMTAFFIFIVATLTVSFFHYTKETLPFTVPAALLGMALGYILGVRTEQRKLHIAGMQRYVEHFAHVHSSDLSELNWWSVVNFYSVMGGLVLINAVGLSTVILHNDEAWDIAASTFGAFLLGTIVPYLVYLWMLRTPLEGEKRL